MKPLDDAMQKAGLFYVRFMDDWLVIAPTRWKIRKAVRLVNEVLESLKLEKHPDKTFIGRAERGFSFLGYHLTPRGISAARATIDKMQEHIARLYEQGAGETGIVQYVRRWVRWVFAGLKGLASLFGAGALKGAIISDLDVGASSGIPEIST